MKRSTILLLAVLGCGEERSGSPAAKGDPPAVAPLSTQTNILDSLQVHLAAMRGASAAGLGRMAPEHRRLTEAMIRRRDSEHRGIESPALAAWTALADSIRDDLDAIGRSQADGIAPALPSHEQRIGRLVALHATMIASD